MSTVERRLHLPGSDLHSATVWAYYVGHMTSLQHTWKVEIGIKRGLQNQLNRGEVINLGRAWVARVWEMMLEGRELVLLSTLFSEGSLGESSLIRESIPLATDRRHSRICLIYPTEPRWRLNVIIMWKYCESCKGWHKQMFSTGWSEADEWSSGLRWLPGS